MYKVTNDKTSKWQNIKMTKHQNDKTSKWQNKKGHRSSKEENEIK